MKRYMLRALLKFYVTLNCVDVSRKNHLESSGWMSSSNSSSDSGDGGLLDLLLNSDDITLVFFSL